MQSSMLYFKKFIKENGVVRFQFFDDDNKTFIYDKEDLKNLNIFGKHESFNNSINSSIMIPMVREEWVFSDEESIRNKVKEDSIQIMKHRLSGVPDKEVRLISHNDSVVYSNYCKDFKNLVSLRLYTDSNVVCVEYLDQSKTYKGWVSGFRLDRYKIMPNDLGLETLFWYNGVWYCGVNPQDLMKVLKGE